MIYLSVTWKLCSCLQVYSMAAHAQITAYSFFLNELFPLSFFNLSFSPYPWQSSKGRLTRFTPPRNRMRLERGLTFQWPVVSSSQGFRSDTRAHTHAVARVITSQRSVLSPYTTNTLYLLWEDKRNYCTVTVVVIRAWDSCEMKHEQMSPFLFFFRLPLKIYIRP